MTRLEARTCELITRLGVPSVFTLTRFRGLSLRFRPARGRANGPPRARRAIPYLYPTDVMKGPDGGG